MKPFQKAEAWTQEDGSVVRAHLQSMTGEDMAAFCARWDIYLATVMAAFPC